MTSDIQHAVCMKHFFPFFILVNCLLCIFVCLFVVFFTRKVILEREKGKKTNKITKTQSEMSRACMCKNESHICEMVKKRSLHVAIHFQLIHLRNQCVTRRKRQREEKFTKGIKICKESK